MSNGNADFVYRNMVAGVYDVPFFSIDTGRKELGIDVKKVRQACKEYNLDFNRFMEYARERKVEELEE